MINKIYSEYLYQSIYMVVQHRSLSSSASYLPITNTATGTTLTTVDDESNNPNSTIMANNSSNNAMVAVIKQNYYAICSCLILYSIMAGYVAGIQPTDQFRYFSYHPLLMTCGMVGTMSIGTITKKIGGYANTKVSSTTICILCELTSFSMCTCRNTERELTGSCRIHVFELTIKYFSFSQFFFKISYMVFYHGCRL